MMNLDTLYPKWNCPICKDWFHMPYKFCKCDDGVDMSKSADKVVVQLDDTGGFLLEQLRPLLGDKTDTIDSYTVEIVDGGVMLSLFDKEGNKV